MRRIREFAIHRRGLFSRVMAIVFLLAMFVGLLSLTAFAQTTYVITDGTRVLVYTSNATDPADVLDEAGFQLGIDDTYTTQENGGISEIVVQRVQMVTVNNGGQILKTGTYGETVGQLLERLNVSVGTSDQLSAALEDETYDGMEVIISRMNYTTETYSQVLTYETEYCYDPSLPEGTEQLLTAGSDGEAICTALVTYENGLEISRSVTSAQVTQAPVNALIAVGTGREEAAVEGELVIGDGVIITPEGDILTYTGTITSLATAYTCERSGGVGITATGTPARVGAIAVDPKVIPYGTRMFIVSNDGEYIYGLATAEDCGHPDHIVGTRIDLYYDTEAECFEFGARYCTVFVLG